MSGDNIEDEFKRFLADNKIDTSALKGTKQENGMLTDAKDQRTIAILKAVSTPAPLPCRDWTAIRTAATTSTDSDPTSWGS